MNCSTSWRKQQEVVPNSRGRSLLIAGPTLETHLTSRNYWNVTTFIPTWKYYQSLKEWVTCIAGLGDNNGAYHVTSFDRERAEHATHMPPWRGEAANSAQRFPILANLFPKNRGILPGFALDLVCFINCSLCCYTRLFLPFSVTNMTNHLKWEVWLSKLGL